jgi:hypothetical protein
MEVWMVEARHKVHTAAVLTLDGIIAYDLVPGSITTEHFVQFLQELVVCSNVSCYYYCKDGVLCQIPLTNPYPGPHSVLILDNCSIHHSEQVQQLVEDKACKPLVFYTQIFADVSQYAALCSSCHTRLIWILSSKHSQQSKYTFAGFGRTSLSHPWIMLVRISLPRWLGAFFMHQVTVENAPSVVTTHYKCCSSCLALW